MIDYNIIRVNFDKKTSLARPFSKMLKELFIEKLKFRGDNSIGGVGVGPGPLSPVHCPPWGHLQCKPSYQLLSSSYDGFGAGDASRE